MILVIGAPGAGKGTLCKKLAHEHGLKHVSVGDVLRQTVQGAGEDEPLVGYVRRAELLPTQLLFPILQKHLKGSNEPDEGRPVLLDGFPRRLDQTKAFAEVFGPPRLVLYFSCPEKLAKSRVLGRMAGREGDNAETFQKRYNEFVRLNPPIVDFYREQDKLIEIDTSGVTDVSYEALLEALKTRPGWGL